MGWMHSACCRRNVQEQGACSTAAGPMPAQHTQLFDEVVEHVLPLDDLDGDLGVLWCSVGISIYVT
jgi:hypothetical protein